MLGQELAKVFARDDLILWDREDIDITDNQMVDEKIRLLKPDLIINAAAYNAVDEAEEMSELAFSVNAGGPRNLAMIAKELLIVFVHYSTDYVFEGEKEKGYTEEDIPNPVSEYGRSKLAGELAVQEIGGKYYIIRLSRLFGKPALSVGAKKSFVDVMRKLAEEKDSLDVVDEEFSCPTYALDVANRTKEIVEGDYDYGIYHAANNGACTWYGLAEEIFKVLNKKMVLSRVGSDMFPRPARRPRYSVLINEKMPMMRNWQEALKEYLLEGEMGETKKQGEVGKVKELKEVEQIIDKNEQEAEKGGIINITSDNKVMKGIILAGGKGTRLKPLTKITSKQLLPVYDKPMIMYPLETLIKAGIKDILIIVAPDYAGQFLQLLGSGKDLGVKISYEIQDEPKGLPEAFIIGENFIGDDNVTLILGDNLFFDHDFVQDIQSFEKGGRIFAVDVPDPQRFGVVEFDTNMRVVSIEEKPQNPKSNYAIPGIYIFDSRVCNIAKGIKPTWRPETDITEVMNAYRGMNELDVRMVNGRWLDTGTFESLLKAANVVAAEEYKKKLGFDESIFQNKK